MWYTFITEIFPQLHDKSTYFVCGGNSVHVQIMGYILKILDRRICFSNLLCIRDIFVHLFLSFSLHNIESCCTTKRQIFPLERICSLVRTFPATCNLHNIKTVKCELWKSPIKVHARACWFASSLIDGSV